MINIVRFCYSEIMARKLQLGICFLLSVLSSVTVSIMPYLNGYFIDTLITEKSLSSIWTLAIFSLVIISVGFIIGYIKSILIIRIQMSIEFEVYKRILKDVNDISISILRKLDKAALNQKVIKDTSIVVSFCTLSVPNMIVNAILLILYVTLISKLSIRFLFMIVVFSIMYYTLSKYFSKKLYDADKRAKKEQDQYYGRTFEQYNNIEFVKAHGLNDSLHHRLDGSFGGLLEATIARQKTSYVFSGIESYLALLSQLVIIFLGGKAVIENSMTLGDFVVLNSYVAMTLGMVKFFYNFEQTVQSTLASLHRLEEILILNKEINGKRRITKVSSIGISNCYLTFEDSRKILFPNIIMQTNRIYAIVGSNGTGKTTMLLSIMGLYNNILTGQISINGRAIECYDMKYLRENAFSYAEQTPVIFEGKVDENLSFFGKFPLKRNQHDVIQALIGGNIAPNRVICFEGEGVSGGESKRITLLRAVNKNGNVFLFDEPTVMLDENSANLIIKELVKLKTNRILLIVTHDQRILEVADEVIRL